MASDFNRWTFCYVSPSKHHNTKHHLQASQLLILILKFCLYLRHSSVSSHSIQHCTQSLMDSMQHWVTSLFELVPRSVFSLSPKTMGRSKPTCVPNFGDQCPRYYYFRFLKTNVRHVRILLNVFAYNEGVMDDEGEEDWLRQGWRSETGSLFQRWGDACRKERFVILNEELAGGRERVTTEEVRVQRGGWREIRLCR